MANEKLINFLPAGESNTAEKNGFTYLLQKGYESSVDLSSILKPNDGG